MAAIDDFKTRFPEFSVADVDAKFPLIYPTWQCYFNGNYENECDKEIILNLLAHLLVSELSIGSSAIGSEQSKSVGNVSVTYSKTVTGQTVDFFSSTKYGARYLQLISFKVGAYCV